MMSTTYDAENMVWMGPKEDFDTSQSLGEVMLANLLRQGDKVIQIYHDTRNEMTAAQMYQKSIKLANKLRDFGVRQGDVVTVSLKNEPNTAPTVIALLALGAVTNLLDQINLTKPNGDVSFLKKVKPQYIICHKDVLDLVVEHATNFDITTEYVTLENCSGRHPSIEEWLESEEDESEFILPVIEDTDKTIALILPSSGTTGVPKAICISHGSFLSTIKRMTVIVDWGVTYNPSPIDWVSGSENCLGSIFRGKVRIITSLPLLPEHIIDIIETHGVTEVFCDPSRMYPVHSVLKERKIQLPTVRLMGCGGTLVSEDLRLAIEHCFPNAAVAIGYGLTEMGVITASLLGNRGFSVGFLLRGQRIKIIGPNGEKLGPNETGEVYLKSDHEFIGYYVDGETHKLRQDDDGYFGSEDNGYIDEDGYMFITGRKQDLLQYLHQVINPRDIETVIEKHEGISRACVVAVTIPIYYDIPAAVCVRHVHSTVAADELHEWLADKLPDNHKLRGGIYFVDVLPLTRSGKIRRIDCKDMVFRWYHENDVQQE